MILCILYELLVNCENLILKDRLYLFRFFLEIFYIIFYFFLFLYKLVLKIDGFCLNYFLEGVVMNFWKKVFFDFCFRRLKVVLISLG